MMMTSNRSTVRRRHSRSINNVVAVIGVVILATFVSADTFNYDTTDGDNYGPQDWDRVRCPNLDNCEGWPDKHLGSIGWELDRNMCLHCPASGQQDGECDHTHRMSPVDLLRDRAIADHKNWKDCPDWHWMNFEDGTCTWDDMKDAFKIERHALQMIIPMRNNGDIDCASETGFRKYPRLDYSKGFPDWWHLDRTEIKVPSEHTQHGKRYAAEIVLSHFYELDHWKNQIGYVSLFMQDYPGQQPWHYLDKLICMWRREEEKQRKDCGLPPAPVYKMCELYRGQTRTFEDFEFFEEPDDSTSDSGTETGQLERPEPIPIENLGANPDSSMLPLQLCQGDCDFDEDCAEGLMCHRREAFGPVPGCIGGEENSGTADYCVFDPFGPGYQGPTVAPTGAPTITSRPTLVQPDPRPYLDWSGTPPLSALPLQRCHGDCDTDDDCAEGLVCFQRIELQAIPGCIGGETLDKPTDFCIVDPFGDGSYVDPVTPTAETTATPTGQPITPTEATTVTPSGQPTSASPPTSIPTVSPQTGSPTENIVEKNATEAPTEATAEDGEVTEAPVPDTDGLKEVSNLGWEPPFQLDECEGDCDDDSDCLPGLVCFDRDASNTPVPGCAGGESDFSLTDYCIRPVLEDLGDNETVIGRLETDAPTESPIDATISPTTTTATASPTVTPTETPVAVTTSPTETPVAVTTTSPTLSTGSPTNIVVPSTATPVNPIPLIPIGWSPPELPLGLCEGDCDEDSDCGPGLKCFQRFLPKTDVPGCIGGAEDMSLMDYCIVDSTEIVINAPISTLAPSDPPVQLSFNEVSGPPEIDCASLEGQVANTDTGRTVSLQRLCDPHPDECCQDPRSNSNYCHEMYDFLGDRMTSVCHHCCLLESRAESLPVGPANAPKDGLEPYNECHLLDNTNRFCKDNGCCNPETSGTPYCQSQFALHPGDVERICWYCCHPSKEFSPENRRQLPELESSIVSSSTSTSPLHAAMTEQEMIEFYNNDDRPMGEGDKFFEDSTGRKLIVRAENFEPKTTVEEDEIKFEQMHDAFQRRELQTSIAENYDDVYWWPYEWLLKVGTEYYFRYEGSMTVPPCYTVNHWRVLKDPIRVASHQIKELERLLAWRLNEKCDADTAGKPRDGNPDAVDVARPLQKLERGHRMVFCECQDWPSKFPAERQWCRKWQERDPELRLFQNPYNWYQEGF